MTEIPPSTPAEQARQISTRNTKEAALLYAIQEVRPCLSETGDLYAFRVKDHKGDDVCYFCFQDTPEAQQIHQAFTDPSRWIAEHGETIPDEYMPTVLALILQSWHNWERLKEATQGLPLHHLKQKGGKLVIAAEPRKQIPQ